MQSFLQRHGSNVIGVLSGWDRLRFRGTLRMLANVVGMGRFLSYSGVLLKEFGDYAREASVQVRKASLELADSGGRPLEHLASPNICKEDRAREYLAASPVAEGLICTLTAVEPCGTYDIKFNHRTGKLELVHAYRKCQHLYHYFMHPIFGFMHVRLQTWLPFNLHVCINGREWLGRQMDAQGIKYLRRENCFPWVSDVAGAQQLLDEQVKHPYTQTLGTLAGLVNPYLKLIVRDYDINYYWSLEESEMASDVMFKSQAALDQLYPSLLRHGMESFASPDVLRFLGHKLLPGDRIPPALKMEVVSDLKTRPEGTRIKHRVGGNSVKMYNKQATVLRVEATLNNMRQLKAPRTDEQGKVVWKQMRKGVADIGRRAEVSKGITDRYLDQMAVVDTPLPLKTLAENLSKPATYRGRRVRGLNLLGDDARLLAAIGQGQWLIHGLRNRDLRELLLPCEAGTDAKEVRRRSGQITRKLGLLRAHGLIQKVSRSNRYMLTEMGRQAAAVVQAAKKADIHKLLAAA